jgi:TolB-like protein/Tfp pilus assembly protein PilF
VTKTLEAQIEALSTGSTFAGRYQIVEELGKGGMGKVYRAVDKKLNEEVALKLIKPEIASDSKILERFSQELKIARKIVHKNVGRMYELMEEGGTHFITMEFVAGQDLRGLIRQTGQLAVGTALSIAKQVCEGLSEAHKLGVIHRDLKPSNIMIDREGQARIMDFGIARTLKGKGITDKDAIIGTPEYMSPEQVEGKEADARSDIYSFGIILYEMVTGRVPFEGDTPFSVAFKHKTEVPKSPIELNIQIPEDLSRLILKCLEKNCEKRYQTAGEILRELENIEKMFPTMERIAASRKMTAGKLIQPRWKRYLFPIGVPLLAVAIAAAVLFVLESGRKGSGQKIMEQTRASAQKETPAEKSGLLPAWKNSIAVLPFKNLNPDQDQEYFCDGMTEQLISNLGVVKELKVKARTSVMAYKNTTKDIPQIGRELGVSNILEGSISKSGQRIRIAARLVNVEDGTQLWSKNYDSRLEDAIAIQDEVSQSIASALQFQLTPETSSRLKTPQPANFDAYDYYLKAKHLIDTQYMTSHKEEDFQKALEFARKAVETDPNYADGYLGLSYIYELHYLVTSNKKDLESQWKAIEKAYQLDPNSAGANAVFVVIYLRQNKIEQSFPFVKKALELNPNNATVCHMAGLFYHYLGLHFQAIDFYSRAIELDPSGFFSRSNRGIAYLDLNEFEKARHDFQNCLVIQPNDSSIFSTLALTSILQKDFAQAEKFLALVEKENLNSTTNKLVRSMLYASQGEKDKALGVQKSSYVYAFLEMTDEAVALIPKELEGRSPWWHSYHSLTRWPVWDKLQSDPRFQAIVSKQKARYEENLAKFKLD